jgi:hypothetical protein
MVYTVAMSRHHLSPLVGEDAEIVEELLCALDYLEYARVAAAGRLDKRAKEIIDAGQPIRDLISKFKNENV